MALLLLLSAPISQDCLVNKANLQAESATTLSTSHAVQFFRSENAQINFLSADPELDKLRGAVEFFLVQSLFYQENFRLVAETCEREAHKLLNAFHADDICNYSNLSPIDNVEKAMSDISGKLTHRHKIISENNSVLKIYVRELVPKYREVSEIIEKAARKISVVEYRCADLRGYLLLFCQEIKLKCKLLENVFGSQVHYMDVIRNVKESINNNKFPSRFNVIEDVDFDTEVDNQLETILAERMKCEDSDFIVMSFEELEAFNRGI